MNPTKKKKIPRTGNCQMQELRMHCHNSSMKSASRNAGENGCATEKVISCVCDATSSRTKDKFKDFRQNCGKSYHTKFTSILSTRNNARTFNESKQAVTFPFWIRTWVGGCAKRHSSSVREQVPRWNSLQTSTSNHRGSLPIMGTIIFGVNMSLVSFSVSRHLTSKSGNHEWNGFFKCATVQTENALPDISRCLGKFVCGLFRRQIIKRMLNTTETSRAPIT